MNKIIKTLLAYIMYNKLIIEGKQKGLLIW